MAQRDGKRGGVWIWVIAGLAVALGVALWVRSSHEAVPVRSARVERTDLSVPVSTNGKVEPIEDFQAHAPVSGVVDKLYVQVGDEVRAGQKLLELDSGDAVSRLATAQAQDAQARLAYQNMRNGGSQDELLSERADLNAAQRQVAETDQALQALQALQAKGAASQNEVALARQRSVDAHAKLEQVRARMQGRYSTGDVQAQQRQIDQTQEAVNAARSSLSGFQVRAPFRGTVYSLPIAEYDFVNASEALINIADLTRLQVRAYFDEPDIGKLAKGQPVTIHWEARPNQTWHGHVTQVPTTVISYNTRNVGECLISVDDAVGDLIPNTNVTVTVTTLQHSNVLSLPREALRTEGNSTFVYRIRNDRLERVPVTVGDSNVTRMEITGGLQLGDVVALNGLTPSTELTEGMRVTQPR